MDEQEPGSPFPPSWQKTDYDPTIMDLKGRAYLNVEGRRAWFIADQRHMIMAGIAKCPFIIQTELVEIDLDRGYAQFKTFGRDVLGNECTMYGSETAKDFGDYAEKASTKSLGRMLAGLGYSTASAQEFDEGERVVDSPQERSAQQQQRTTQRRSSAPEPLPSYQQHPPKQSLRDRMKELGFVDDKTQWRPWVMQVTGKNQEHLWGAGGGTTPEDMQKLKDACERLEAKAAQAQSATRPA
jgi:hypothetical protein